MKYLKNVKLGDDLFEKITKRDDGVKTLLFIKCEILAPSHLKRPFLSWKLNGKLMNVNCRKCG